MPNLSLHTQHRLPHVKRLEEETWESYADAKCSNWLAPPRLRSWQLCSQRQLCMEMCWNLALAAITACRKLSFATYGLCDATQNPAQQMIGGNDKGLRPCSESIAFMQEDFMPAAAQTPALCWNVLEPRASTYRSPSRVQQVVSLPTQCRHSFQQSTRLEDKGSTSCYFLQPGCKFFANDSKSHGGSFAATAIASSLLE